MDEGGGEERSGSRGGGGLMNRIKWYSCCA